MSRVTNQTICLMISVLLMAILCTAAAGKIIYVDDDAVGANDGTNWDNAYVYLQDALATAVGGDEIRVAQGIYKPDLGGGSTPGDRRATFQLINNVILKGGFAGVGELDADVRDVKVYVTILSGDLNGNDAQVANSVVLWDEPSRAENSYHVITGNLTDETSVLDGFTITAGNANGTYWESFGGGMYNKSGSQILTNCTFSGNSAKFGGGMANSENSSPTLTNCTFLDNSSMYGAGGIDNYEDSSPTLTNCTFSGNSSTRGSGGMENDRQSSPTLTNCTFSGNSGRYSGGMANDRESSPILINCTFSGNSAELGGGGMDNSKNSNPTLTNCIFSGNLGEGGGGMANLDESSPTLTNCTFNGNSVDFGGGGMYNGRNCSPTLTNCTFSGNSAQYGGVMCNFENNAPPNLTNCTFTGNSARDGGGMYNFQSNTILTNCTFAQNSAENGNALYCDSLSEAPSNVELINCILWDGGNEIWNDENYSTIMINYSNVQGGFPGEGNIDVDPLFADPGYWADADDPSVLVEPDIPKAVWVDGDYHLKSQAGRWDPNSESWVIDDVTSPCIDAGNPSSPVAFEPFPNGSIINMGAYGGSSQAGKSLSGLDAKYGGGTGEPNDTYLIYTAEQMNTIGAEPNDWDRHFKLMADIDLKDFGSSSFNLVGSDLQPFRGVFDGNGHTISNLTCVVTGDGEPAEDDFIARFGLFRSIDDPNAMIRDLRLVNPDIRPASTCEKRLWNVGALVGSLGSGFISNCSIEGGQVRGERGVGGLAGSNWGTISDCYTTCKVGPAEQRSLADVNEPFDRCEFFGGLVGVNFREISNCHAVGEVSGERTVGGLVGEAYGRISNSWSGGDVSGDYSIGGLIGMTRRPAQISDCYATGHVSGRRSVGGLVGSSSKDSSINSCYVTGSVFAEQEAGGLVGLHEGTLSKCCSIATVSAASDTAGGLVGFNGGTIFTSLACGDVSGRSNIGGLVGENIKWSQLIAGILFEYDGIVVDSYAKGSVYGEDGIGGLIGDNSGTVLGSYSTGRVTGERNFGGLVGVNGKIPVMGSFWDTETSGLDTSSGGTGKTTAEMQTAGTFLVASWDFVDETENGTEDIWSILEGQDYPRLWWETIE